MLKKLWIYPIVFLVTLALVLGYGFIFGGEFPLWLIGVFTFCNVLFLSCFYFKETKEKPVNKIMTILIVSFVLVFLCVFAYDGVNELGRTKLYSYESTVYYSTSVRGGKYLVKVKDPDGNEQALERFDANLLSPVLADDEYIDYTNETIKVTVYTGLFGIEYSIWDE